MKTRLSPAASLALWLVVLTLYRMWVIPRLGVTLYVDEAQYWTWAQQPDWGYFSKPPVIAWLIAACTALFGDGLVAVKLPGLLLYPATAWIVFRLGERLFDTRTGWLAGIAVSLLPIVSALGLFVSTDAPLLFFWSAAMLALHRALEANRWRDWLLLGIACGLGVMSKYTMGAFGVSAALFLLVERSRWPVLVNPRLWVAVLLAALLVLPNILWNVAHDFPTLRHTADITHVDGANTKTGNVGEFLLAQWASLGPGIGLAFLGGVAWALRRWREARMQWLLAFSVPLLGLVFAQALRSEANGNWAAPALLAACLLGIAWLAGMKPVWLRLVLGLNLVLMLTVYHVGDAYRFMGKPMTARGDFLKRARGWDQLAQAVAPYLRAHPQALLLTDHRSIAAHLLYELRGQITDHAAWAPYRHPQDHYQLTVPLGAQHVGRDVLLVTLDTQQQLTERFASTATLARVSVPVQPGLVREVDVLLLRGFKGYAASASAPATLPAAP